MKYGYIISRTITCSERINEYLEGKTDKIDALAETRLPYKLTGFPKYPRIIA